ncbi:Plant UBX domain-containing protein 1 [Quillaja saponaria]|uniref:Plant UBX domain-containing protein 1 n=1 Tax=Quillaja saponaria TaxID=32244 RepID=A0AAD7Q4I9_QUISA|nr:Plant UBX domain-containing protein 1 [Quillaja saponaria]
MTVDGLLPLYLKRRKLANLDSMESETAKVALAAMKEKLGREIRVFETASLSPLPNDVSNSEVGDDFYDFTAEDYYRILATKKEDKFLKTRKIREAEGAARKSRITKAVIRVRFPDNHTLEVTFHPSETVQSLVDLLSKVVAQPEKPFYIYTTPPKKRIKYLSQDFHGAGFVPGAIVYFSYDVPEGEIAASDNTGPFLQEEIMSLKGLELATEQGQQEEPVGSAPEPVEAALPPAVQERKPVEKKIVKPKWLKM